MTVTQSVEETIDFGQRIGESLQVGDTVLLSGELGAGKTHLTKGIAAGLGVANPKHVNSPTFVLVQQYEGRMPLYHFDCYRLGDAAEFVDLGYEEFLLDGVCVIEWAERVLEHLSQPWLHIRIKRGDTETERRFNLEWNGLPSDRHVSF